jgi:tRNA (mo5U34)-methyltransferase
VTLQSAATHDPEIGALAPWFHNLHLPDGRQTAPDHPLGDFPSFKWREIESHVPADLRGWCALDIGCNAGFYSVELAQRGAHVTALELDAHYLRQARWVAKQYGLDHAIDFRQGTVYELAGSDEQWDIVLFMGVLYHLRHPLLALDAVAAAVRRLLVLQTLTMPGDRHAHPTVNLDLDERRAFLDPAWPKMAFVEHTLAGDETNWWAPNAACVEAMARSAGLRIEARPAHEVWLCTPAWL